MKRLLYISIFGILLLLAGVIGAVLAFLQHPALRAARSTTTTSASDAGLQQNNTSASGVAGSSNLPNHVLYSDAKLGFRLQIPDSWVAHPQPGSQARTENTLVIFEPTSNTAHQLVTVGVTHSSAMPATFARRGVPAFRVGPYSAFVLDRTLKEARLYCMVRLFLAQNDYVLADWCAPDASSHSAEFEQMLATYLPAPASFQAKALSFPAPQTCQQARTEFGYDAASWGTTLATPSSLAPGRAWFQLSPGVYLCSNDSSPDAYLFQCTELINRFIAERWGLPHIPGHSARYYDYYQDGVLHPGVVRDFPEGSYQFSDDASQATSAFKPIAGDLLIFQDVNNPLQGWRSGLVANSPGHIALVTGTDAAHVYVAQENYNNTQYFLALPMRRVARGYAITDLSGISNRIVRGWIHFTANGGAL